MVNSIARVYGIKKSEASKRFANSIVEVGTVSQAARAAVAALKAIPGIGVSAMVINAVVAGCIVAALGEGSIYAFEQVALGNRSFDDLDWLQKLLESKLTANFVEKAKGVLAQSGGKADKQGLAQLILALFLPASEEKADGGKAAPGGR